MTRARRLGTLLLAVWLVLAGGASPARILLDADVAHAALHWVEQAHHHHDDDSTHDDGSLDSLTHVAQDVWGGNTAISIAPTTQAVQPAGSDRFGSVNDRCTVSWTDGPFKPPRQVS